MHRFLPLLLCTLMLFNSCSMLSRTSRTPPERTAGNGPNHTIQPTSNPTKVIATPVPPSHAIPDLVIAPPPVSRKISPPNYQTITSNSITFFLLTFDERTHYCAVADQTSLGQKWTSAQQACGHGIAAINGGFFQMNGAPLGHVISHNRKAGIWSTASSLTSGVYRKSSRRMSLTRSRNASRSTEHLLQSGPFLIENKKAVSGLSKRKVAYRSLILKNNKGRWGIAMTTPCSLGALASALDHSSFRSKFDVSTALNLDGGRSCDFYVSRQVNGSEVKKAHWFKNPVRNYLVVTPY